MGWALEKWAELKSSQSSRCAKALLEPWWASNLRKTMIKQPKNLHFYMLSFQKVKPEPELTPVLFSIYWAQALQEKASLECRPCYGTNPSLIGSAQSYYMYLLFGWGGRLSNRRAVKWATDVLRIWPAEERKCWSRIFCRLPLLYCTIK